MPVSKLDASRYQFRGALTSRDLEGVAADPLVRVLQTCYPADLATWRLLDDEFFARRSDVQLRVYGFYSETCDLRFARVLKNVRRFAADCLQRASGIEEVGSIPELETLSIGVFDLETFEFLNSVSPRLQSLFLGATASKKPRLAPLVRFRELSVLSLEGQQNGIEVISELSRIQDVTLHSISTLGLDYLAPLREVWSLDLKLGGIRDLSAIRGKPCIKYFEAWQVRGLSDLSVLAELPGLQNLFLQSLPQVRSLPSFSKSSALRRVVLANMRGLKDFSSLESAPSLEEFALIDGRGQEPDDLMPVLRNPALRRVKAGFGSLRKNESFDRMAKDAGREPFTSWETFDYREGNVSAGAVIPIGGPR